MSKQTVPHDSAFNFLPEVYPGFEITPPAPPRTPRTPRPPYENEYYSDDFDISELDPNAMVLPPPLTIDEIHEKHLLENIGAYDDNLWGDMYVKEPNIINMNDADVDETIYKITNDEKKRRERLNRNGRMHKLKNMNPKLYNAIQFLRGTTIVDSPRDVKEARETKKVKKVKRAKKTRNIVSKHESSSGKKGGKKTQRRSVKK